MDRVKVSAVVFGIEYEGMNVIESILTINNELPNIPFKENLEKSVADLLGTLIKDDSPFVQWNLSEIYEEAGSLNIVIACLVPNKNKVSKEGVWLQYEELSEEMQRIVFAASNKI